MGKSIQKLSSVTRVGLDLAKRVFQVHAVDANGEIVAARKLARGRLVDFFSELPRCAVAMEACPSSHHWGRQLLALGFEVRLIPPAHVKPYVRRNKNDAVDAAAICEAAGRPGQRLVPVRSIENQAELMRHRARELLAGQRTAALNALRGHLAEIGVDAPQGAQHAYDLKRLAVDGFDEYGEAVVPDSDRQRDRNGGQGQRDRQAVDDHSRRRPGHRLGDYGHDPGHRRLRQWARVRGLPRLDAMPELDRRQVLGRITKMGDRYLRKLLVVGACACHAPPSQRHNDALRLWASGMLERKTVNTSSR
jgi:transposase